MQFNHDNMIGVELAVALVNGGSWTREHLREVLLDHRVRVDEVAPDDVDDLQAWAQRLRRAFEAPSPEVRCDVINVLLADGAGPAYLTMHDGLRPHLHFASDNDQLVSRVKALTASGLAIFTVGASGARLGVCARTGCTTVFCDTSRNGTRAYCTARCGNHEAVRRHRGSVQGYGREHG